MGLVNTVERQKAAAFVFAYAKTRIFSGKNIWEEKKDGTKTQASVESFSSLTFTAAAGIDVGENDEAFTITYSNTGEAAAQPVVFNTNESSALTVNAPGDTVHHYGRASSITVQAVAENSYHEYGEVASLTINSGRLVIGGSVHAPEVIVAPSQDASVKLEISGGAEVDLLTVSGTSENVAITNNGTTGTPYVSDGCGNRFRQRQRLYGLPES